MGDAPSPWPMASPLRRCLEQPQSTHIFIHYYNWTDLSGCLDARCMHINMSLGVAGVSNVKRMWPIRCPSQSPISLCYSHAPWNSKPVHPTRARQPDTASFNENSSLSEGLILTATTAQSHQKGHAGGEREWKIVNEKRWPGLKQGAWRREEDGVRGTRQVRFERRIREESARTGRLRIRPVGQVACGTPPKLLTPTQPLSLSSSPSSCEHLTQAAATTYYR